MAYSTRSLNVDDKYCTSFELSRPFQMAPKKPLTHASKKKIKMQYYFSSSKCIQHLYMTSMVVSCLRSFKIKTTQCCTTFELNRTFRMMPKSLRCVLKKIYMQYHSNAVSVKCIQHPNMTSAVVCCLRSSKMMKA